VLYFLCSSAVRSGRCAVRTTDYTSTTFGLLQSTETATTGSKSILVEDPDRDAQFPENRRGTTQKHS
jgi:hypothetical protein